jgi:S-adenosylmethionine-diacylglycerol 3-amino-3-carboxypropyl transferase
VVAVDRGLDQLYALELKAGAMQALDHGNYCGFLGLWDHEDRLACYRAARPALSPGAQRYWDRRLELIREGVLYCGRAETTVARMFALARRLGPLAWIDDLFAIRSLEEQRLFLKSDPSRMHRLELALRAYCYPLVVFGLTRDRSFLRSTKDSIGRYMHRCVERWFERNLAHESFVLHLFGFGRYPEAGPLPPYLTREGFEKAKALLDRMELHHGRLEEFVRTAELTGRVKWSLSDISAWMPEPAFQDLLRVVCRTGEAGSRFCARTFVADRALPPDLFPRVMRLDALSTELDQTDASVFWSFDVCEYAP